MKRIETILIFQLFPKGDQADTSSSRYSQISDTSPFLVLVPRGQQQHRAYSINIEMEIHLHRHDTVSAVWMTTFSIVAAIRSVFRYSYLHWQSGHRTRAVVEGVRSVGVKVVETCRHGDHSDRANHPNPCHHCRLWRQRRRCKIWLLVFCRSTRMVAKNLKMMWTFPGSE